MRTFINIGLLGVAGLFATCKSTLPPDREVLTAPQDPVEGMVFLVFKVQHDSISGTDIKLISKIIVPQKQKSDPGNAETPDRILIRQTDRAGRLISVNSVDHPLMKRVEIAADDGKLESRNIRLKEAEVAARVTLYRKTAYIQVAEELNREVIYTKQFKIRE